MNNYDKLLIRSTFSNHLLTLIIDYLICHKKCIHKNNYMGICLPCMNTYNDKSYKICKSTLDIYRIIAKTGLITSSTYKPCKRSIMSYVTHPTNIKCLRYALEKNVHIFIEFDRISKRNRNITKYALGKDSGLIQYIHSMFKYDEELWNIAITTSAYMYKYAPFVIKNNLNIINNVINQNKGMYKYIPDEYKY